MSLTIVDRIPSDAAAARDMIAAGDLQRADVLLRDALGVTPGNAELLYLRGVIANRQHDSLTAAAFLTAAVAASPNMTSAWLALGHAQVNLGQLRAAEQAYGRAAALEPSAADPHFNLGVVHTTLDDDLAAARAFCAAWRRDAQWADAAKACVGALGRWLRNTPEVALPTTPLLVADLRKVSVIVCSIDDAKAAHAKSLYDRLLVRIPHEIIAIRNAASLAEAYNRGIDGADGDVVVLSHDDVDVLAPDFGMRLLAHLQEYDVVGVVGGTQVAGPLPSSAGHPHLRGWITHHAPGKSEWNVDILDPRPLAGEVKVLDGVLLAARHEVFASIRFDTVTFDGFHGYDIDWSYRAALSGFRVGVAGDLLLVHASRGKYDEVWQQYADRFCLKHGVCRIEPAPGPFYRTTLTSAAQVRAFFALLTDFSAADVAM